MRQIALSLLVSITCATSLLLAFSALPTHLGTIAVDAATGDVSMMPGEVQSTCDASGHRVGFMEFRLPNGLGRITRATLFITENRGIILDEWAPAVHDVWWYRGDGLVTLSDLEIAAAPLASFQTDVNEIPQSFQFDVTQIVQRNRSKIIGFRVNTHDSSCAEFNGSRFGVSASQWPFLTVEHGGRQSILLPQ